MPQQLSKEKRDSIIIKTSIIGIATNILLASFKAFVGVLSSSIAIILDAVNNLSDAMSSAITIIGTKLAGKSPDKKHPFGYGRIEYLSAAIISVIVLYAGTTALVSSIKKIITPELPNYSASTLIIVTSAVVIKFILGKYVKKTGEKVSSDALIASGQDAAMDSVISASTLVAAFIFIFTGFSLEAFLGAIISLFIIKAGLEMLKGTLSEILGERLTPARSKEIKKFVSSIEGVNGAYDLLVHNYGPNTEVASIHIEVDDTMNAADIDKLSRTVEAKVYQKFNIIISAIGVYASNTSDNVASRMRKEISEIVTESKYVLQMHGFHLDEDTKNIVFDLVVSFEIEDKAAFKKNLITKLENKYEGYKFNIKFDIDISD
ncbi:cation diffusion facilitator family transporter [Butyrivibrio sp. NC3005]|uniref:cation diffusion facilitator family transporter n=1 Tax=Butyrivibrio sp. NC3005 TaxID=1280685 RepID=UPI00047D41FC|nr:cation diffusion facilitator family transporter [Butyrivibrio sp. NC3005]